MQASQQARCVDLERAVPGFVPVLAGDIEHASRLRVAWHVDRDAVHDVVVVVGASWSVVFYGALVCASAGLYVRN